MLSVPHFGLCVFALFALVVTTRSVDPNEKDAKIPWKLTNLETLARKTDCSARASKQLMNRYRSLQIYDEYKSDIRHTMLHYLARCTQKLKDREYGNGESSSGSVSVLVYDDELAPLKSVIGMKSTEFEVDQAKMNRLSVGRAIMPYIKSLGFNSRLGYDETVKSFRTRLNDFVRQSTNRPCEATKLNSQPQHPDFVELLNVAQLLGENPDLRGPSQFENMVLCSILHANEPYDLHLAASFTPIELELEYFGPGAKLLSSTESKRGLELIEAVFIARRKVGGEGSVEFEKYRKWNEATECEKSCRDSCFDAMKLAAHSVTSPNLRIFFNIPRIHEQEEFCKHIKESFFRGLARYLAENGLDEPPTLSKFANSLAKQTKTQVGNKSSLKNIENVRKGYLRTVIIQAANLAGRFPQHPPEQTIDDFIGDDCRKLDAYGMLKWNAASAELEKWRVRQEFGRLSANWVIYTNICRIHLYESDWLKSELRKLHPTVYHSVSDDSSDESTPDASPLRRQADQSN